MKTIVQRLPLEENSSIIAKTYETPFFETPYHRHNEYELMVIKKGFGTALIGDFIGEYKTGDVYLHGKNLPHSFRKKTGEMLGSSMVVHFREDFLGSSFLNMPEMSSISRLLKESSYGICCKGGLKKNIGKKLTEIEHLSGYHRIIHLLNTLYEISISDEYYCVSGLEDFNYSVNNQIMINLVFDYSLANYKRKISLEEVSKLTNKSVSAFSHYFKKTTKISYVNFLNQIRITHAKKLLKETNLSISEICYESGFRNWANFSKQFKNHCNISPSQYRSEFKELSEKYI